MNHKANEADDKAAADDDVVDDDHDSDGNAW